MPNLRLCLVLTAVGAAALLAGATPVAAQTEAALLTDEIALTVGDDGRATGKAQLVNLTAGLVDLKVAVSDEDKSCTVSPESARLAAGRQTDVGLTLTGCGLGDGGSRTLDLTAGTQSWEVVAVAADPPQPPWDRLNWFWIAAVLALVLVLCVYLSWDGRRAKRTLKTELPGLGSDYDFAKSWASNATIVAGAFAAVFGATDVLEAVLGKEDAAIVGLLAVSAGLAVGLIAAGPLLIATFKTKGQVTPFGLLAGAFVTLTATGGQFGVLAHTAWRLDLGWVDELSLGLGICGTLLLLAYSWRSLSDSLTEGLVKPKTEAAAVAAPVKTKAEAADLAAAGKSAEELVEELYPDTGGYVLMTSRGDEPRRRSAVL